MRPQRLRTWLAAVSVLFLCCAVTVLAASILVPCEVATRQMTVTSAIPDERSTRREVETPSLQDFEAVFHRRFQAPLYDPPPVEEAPPMKEPPPPPPQVRLLATMIEPEASQAMFSDATGAVLIKTVGQQVSDQTTSAEIVDIKDSQVVLRHEGQLITLKLDMD